MYTTVTLRPWTISFGSRAETLDRIQKIATRIGLGEVKTSRAYVIVRPGGVPWRIQWKNAERVFQAWADWYDVGKTEWREHNMRAYGEWNLKHGYS